jgi:hypothetical protein
MMGRINGLAKAAASASLVAGAILATAGPAAAAGPNQSDGAAATGLISLAPVAPASFPGTSPATVASVNVAGLLTTGVITDTADATDASSTIANVDATLTAVAAVRAAAVTSSCTFDTNTGAVTGTSGITNGRVALVGLPNITLDANAAPNTNVDVTVAGLDVATITLNRQVTAADGTLTVDAIYVQLLNSTQTITIGTSTCNAASVAPVPVLPGMALPIGLGALGLLGLGGVGFVVARRRRTAPAAA